MELNLKTKTKPKPNPTAFCFACVLLGRMEAGLSQAPVLHQQLPEPPGAPAATTKHCWLPRSKTSLLSTSVLSEVFLV